jgi:hypothetical protein
VVVVSGKGTPTDPYVVSTVPTATCIGATFTVINGRPGHRARHDLDHLHSGSDQRPDRHRLYPQ